MSARGTVSASMSIKAQERRRAELTELAATRRLWPAEIRERDTLDQRFYMRVWRQQQRDAERALQARQAGC